MYLVKFLELELLRVESRDYLQYKQASLADGRLLPLYTCLQSPIIPTSTTSHSTSPA